MNDAPMKQPETMTNETPAAQLSEPHFDEIAVLIAQPVEPLPAQRDWFAWLAKPRMMIAILAVAALLGTTALALTLQLPRARHADSAATEIKGDESKATETKATETQAEPDESPLGAITEQLKRTAPRRRSRRAAGSDETKPVARRVGVIYGSSSDRP